MQTEQVQMNRVLNHIALHVPDIDAAIDFYTSLFGFRKLKNTPRCVNRSLDPDAPVFRVYDERLQQVKVAFLTTGNGIGFELFQFIDPPMSQRADFDYTRGGVFHIAITDSDPEELCRKVVAAGGKKIGETVVPATAKGENECTLYVADPWGYTLEICSCSFEKLMANRGE
jgi:catechol 2,3-dioxygenase-like lactoylglutathione lyase family enzyme